MKRIKCNCPFSVLNNMICSHAFTLMNALQIKHLGYCGGDVSFWRDEVNNADPSSADIIPKNQQAKKMRSFVDKLADKTRLRRARHKGGYVPGKMKKVTVEYFESDKEDDADDESGHRIDQPMISDDENDLAGAIGDSEIPENSIPNSEQKKQGVGSAKDTEQKMNRKTVEMYDLMLKTGTKVKAYSK